MRRLAAYVVFCALVTTTSVLAAPSVQKLVPATAPRGARAIVIGLGLDAGTLAVSFAAGGTQTVVAEIVSRTTSLVEVIVPATAVTGKVVVTASGTEVGRFDFTLATDPGFVSVATLASGLREPSSAVVLLPDGRLLVADTKNHRIAEISTSGAVTVFAGAGKSGL